MVVVTFFSHGSVKDFAEGRGRETDEGGNWVRAFERNVMVGADDRWTFKAVKRK